VGSGYNNGLRQQRINQTAEQMQYPLLSQSVVVSTKFLYLNTFSTQSASCLSPE